MNETVELLKAQNECANIIKQVENVVLDAIKYRISKDSLIRFIESLYEDNPVKANYTTMLNNIEPYRYFLDANNRWGIYCKSVAQFYRRCLCVLSRYYAV